jgi:hypothetical protein
MGFYIKLSSIVGARAQCTWRGERERKKEKEQRREREKETKIFIL